MVHILPFLLCLLSVLSRNDGPGPGVLWTTERQAGKCSDSDAEGVPKSPIRVSLFSQPLCTVIHLLNAGCFILWTKKIIYFFTVFVCLSPPDPPFHWIPLDRLEKNRSRTPLLPEPTAMDTLYEQLKVSLCLAKRGTNSVLLQTRVSWLSCMSVCFPGQTFLPQAQHPVDPAWSVCGHPKTVQLCGPDQGPGASEAAQSALPHKSPTQSPCNQVTQVIQGSSWYYSPQNNTQKFCYHCFFSLSFSFLLHHHLVTERSGLGSRVMFTLHTAAALRTWAVRMRARQRAAVWWSLSGLWELQSHSSWQSSTFPSTG